MGNNPSGSYQTMVTIYSEEEVKTKLEKESIWELKETTNYTWKKSQDRYSCEEKAEGTTCKRRKARGFKIRTHEYIRKEVLVPNVEKHDVF